MATNEFGMVAIAMPYGKDNAALHALDGYPPKNQTHCKDTWRTLCGRDASTWSRGDDQPLMTFYDSAYSCKRCAAKILG